MPEVGRRGDFSKQRLAQTYKKLSTKRSGRALKIPHYPISLQGRRGVYYKRYLPPHNRKQREVEQQQRRSLIKLG